MKNILFEQEKTEL